MISPVSFGNTNTSSTTPNQSTAEMSWEERKKMPQAYRTPETPSAAASIRGKHKKPSAGKKFFRLVLTTAAAAGALALAAKSGKFKVAEDATGFVNNAKRYIDKAGHWVIDNIQKIFPKAKEAATEATEQAVNAMG